MKYPKFKLANSKDDKEYIAADQNGIYEVNLFNEELRLTEDEMRKLIIYNKPIFEEIKEYDIIIEEISDEDDNIELNWRIQLDVKTTKKKLKEIEEMIRYQLKNYL